MKFAGITLVEKHMTWLKLDLKICLAIFDYRVCVFLQENLPAL